MKKVAVLLSAYNGEEYIKEQIESIYAQDYKDFTLYVRDDGSSLEFTQMLENLQKEYGFVLYLGQNMGFLKSFYWLLDTVKGAQYYAFADQDDIWKPEKLSRAVAWLDSVKKNHKEVPLLYHSAYEVRDEHGKLLSTFHYPDEGYDFRRSLTENHYSGFSMVIDSVMRDYMLRADVSEIDYHDWFAGNIAHGIGIAHSDSYIGAVHRAHRKNVTKITLSRRIKWAIQSFKNESAIHKRALQCEKVFGDKLSEKNQKILALFTPKHYHFGKAMKKCLYPKRWRPALSSELVMRVLMFFGKI